MGATFDDLFAEQDDGHYRPLADRMRPKSLDEFVGQDHLINQEFSLYEKQLMLGVHIQWYFGGRQELVRLPLLDLSQAIAKCRF